MRINLENKAKVEKKSIAPVRISHNLEFPYYWKVQHFSFYSEYKWKLDISVSWDLTSSFLRKKNIFVIFFWNLFFHLLFFFSKPDEKVHSPDSQKSSKRPENWERTKLSTAIKTSPTMKPESLSFRSATSGPSAALHSGMLILSALEKPPSRCTRNPCPRQLHLCFSQAHWNTKRAGGLSQTLMLRSKVGAALAKGLGLEPAPVTTDRHTATASYCWPREEQLQMLH